MLIALGFSLKEIQEWLGHSDIRMTGDVYGHLESASKVALAKQFAQRLNPDFDEERSCEEAQVC